MTDTIPQTDAEERANYEKIADALLGQCDADARNGRGTDLIARLEAAPKGSRELDAEIAAKIGCTKAPQIMPYRPLRVLHPSGRTIDLPHYTTSIDAALTLVPEGWAINVLGQTDKGLWVATLRHIETSKRKMGATDNYGNLPLTSWSRPTPALALCIAALKALDA